MPQRTKIVMLVLNVLPLCHLAAVVVSACQASAWWARFAVIAAGIYIVPPLLARLLLWRRPLPGGSYRLDAPEFLWWWALAQTQVLFCRLPFLEELLRLVPGLYSAWLRLWGARIGRLTYWAPGLRILDRSFLDIGDQVIFGAGVRLNPHVIADDRGGVAHLHLEKVRVGDGCRIGGYSLLSAGTFVEAGQTLKAFSLCPPFTVWRDGRRAKIAVPQ